MGMEAALWTAAIASAVGAGAQTYGSIEQSKMAEKTYEANQKAMRESEQKATEAEIARKQALVAEQSSTSTEKKKKKPTSYQQAGKAYQAQGSGFGLGTDNGTLG